MLEMMTHDRMISAEDGYTMEELIEMYNDAVDTIWCMQEKMHELREDADLWMECAEELMDKVYG